MSIDKWTMAVVVLIVSACGSTTSYQALNRSPRPMTRRPAQSVEVFMLKMPSREFVEVGLLHTEQTSDMSGTSPAELAGLLRAEAAEIGCDGVVMQAADGQYAGGFALTSYTSRAFRASCIMWLRVAASSPALTDGQACQASDSAACMRLAEEAKKTADKMHFWMKACDRESVRACTHAGYAYYRGEGVTANDALASQLLGKACDGRDALACRYLGVMMVERGGDKIKATQKLQLACDDGDAWSCWRLGSYYADKVISPANEEQGTLLFRRACRLGYELGCDSLR
jgi:hypothetical protein